MVMATMIVYHWANPVSDCLTSASVIDRVLVTSPAPTPVPSPAPSDSPTPGPFQGERGIRLLVDVKRNVHPLLSSLVDGEFSGIGPTANR